MKKLFLHIKRLFRKFWFIIIFAFATSFLAGLGLLLIMTIISMLFYDNIVDVDDILENFTEAQLEIILSDKIDERVSDDDYLKLLARYQSYFCPKKADWLTIWTGAEVTDDAYIHYYELKRDMEISKDALKEKILSQVNKAGVQAQRLIRSNKKLVFYYTYRKSGETFDITITPDELKK
jgi:hypothetical protein